jgi:hypothetical protein
MYTKEQIKTFVLAEIVQNRHIAVDLPGIDPKHNIQVLLSVRRVASFPKSVEYERCEETGYLMG